MARQKQERLYNTNVDDFIVSDFSGYDFSPYENQEDDTYLAENGLNAEDAIKVKNYVKFYNQNNPKNPISVKDIVEKDRSGFFGNLQLLGEGIYDAFTDVLPESLARATRGGDIDPTKHGYAYGIIEQQKKDQLARIPSLQEVTGDKLAKSMYQGPLSMATSMATGLGGMALGSAAGSAIPGVGTVAGGVIGAGAMTLPTFYRMAKDQIVEEIQDGVTRARGVPLTSEEAKRLNDAIDSDATTFGLWEAGPEALAQVLTAGLVKGAGGNVIKSLLPAGLVNGVTKNALVRAGVKTGLDILGEEGTEGMTFAGQETLRKKYNLRKTDPTVKEFMEEQAGPVAVGAALNMGAMSFADRMFKRYQEEQGGDNVPRGEDTPDTPDNSDQQQSPAPETASQSPTLDEAWRAEEERRGWTQERQPWSPQPMQDERYYDEQGRPLSYAQEAYRREFSDGFSGPTWNGETQQQPAGPMAQEEMRGIFGGPVSPFDAEAQSREAQLSAEWRAGQNQRGWDQDRQPWSPQQTDSGEVLYGNGAGNLPTAAQPQATGNPNGTPDVAPDGTSFNDGSHTYIKSQGQWFVEGFNQATGSIGYAPISPDVSNQLEILWQQQSRPGKAPITTPTTQQAIPGQSPQGLPIGTGAIPMGQAPRQPQTPGATAQAQGPFAMQPTQALPQQPGESAGQGTWAGSQSQLSYPYGPHGRSVVQSQLDDSQNVDLLTTPGGLGSRQNLQGNALPQGSGAIPMGTNASNMGPFASGTRESMQGPIPVAPQQALPQQPGQSAGQGTWPGGQSQVSYPWGPGAESQTGSRTGYSVNTNELGPISISINRNEDGSASATIFDGQGNTLATGPVDGQQSDPDVVGTVLRATGLTRPGEAPAPTMARGLGGMQDLNAGALPQGTGAMPMGTTDAGFGPIPQQSRMSDMGPIVPAQQQALPQETIPAGMSTPWSGGRSQLARPWGTPSTPTPVTSPVERTGAMPQAAPQETQQAPAQPQAAQPRRKSQPTRRLDTMPEGWRRTKGATTAPTGWYWANNGKSMFDPDYESALIKDESYTDEEREAANQRREMRKQRRSQEEGARTRQNAPTERSTESMNNEPEKSEKAEIRQPQRKNSAAEAEKPIKDNRTREQLLKALPKEIRDKVKTKTKPEIRKAVQEYEAGEKEGGETKEGKPQSSVEYSIGSAGEKIASLAQKAREYGKRVLDAAKAWADVVNKAISEKSRYRTNLDMGQTPSLLVELGIPNRKMRMERRVFNKITGRAESHGHKHELTDNQVKNLYVELADPAAVIKYGDNYTIVTTMREGEENPTIPEDKKTPIIVGLDVDIETGTVNVNEVTSAYGKDGFIGWLKKKAQFGDVVYIEKNKLSEVLDRVPGPNRTGRIQDIQRVVRGKVRYQTDVVKPDIPKQEASHAGENVELNASSLNDPASKEYQKNIFTQIYGMTDKAFEKLWGQLKAMTDTAIDAGKELTSFMRWQEENINDPSHRRQARPSEKNIAALTSGLIVVRPHFRGNGDYAFSLDASTLCVKREVNDRVIQLLIDEGYGQKLGPTQMQIIRDMLAANGYDKPCDVCYVETKRMNMANFAQEVSTSWSTLMQALGIPEDHNIFEPYELSDQQIADLEDLAKDTSKKHPAYDRLVVPTGREKNELQQGLGQDKATKIAKMILDDMHWFSGPDGKTAHLTGSFNPDWLMTSRGTDRIVRTFSHVGGDNGIHGLFGSWYGSGSAKPNESYVPYDPLIWAKTYDVGFMSKATVEEKQSLVLALGGMRAQSFSDFNPLMIVDELQKIWDLAARRLGNHLYAKVPAVVHLFHKTGIKINMSLVPKVVDSVDTEHAGLKPDGKGGWEYAWDKDSFPVDQAFELRKKHGDSGDVGTIAIAISDNHLEKMLDDPEIDYIIPYHKSGLREDVQKQTGLDRAKDYTKEQNTKIPKVNNKPLFEDFLFNKAFQETGDPKKAAQQYLEWIEQMKQEHPKYADSIAPKFERYKDHPNYYKLLCDFRCYKANGKPAVQTPVRFEFPDDFKQRLSEALDEYGIKHAKEENIEKDKLFLNNLKKKIDASSRLDGNVRNVFEDLLRKALGKDSVQTLAPKEFFQALEDAESESMGREAAQEKIQTLRQKNGQVYGFAHKGKIYLNTAVFNAATPAHEFTHVWVKVARQQNPELWKQGKDLLKDTAEWQEVMEDKLYEGIRDDEDAVASEVLARIVGRMAEDDVAKFADPNHVPLTEKDVYAKIKEWLSKFFEGVRSLFEKMVGRPLTLDEFSKMPLHALYDEAERKKFKSALTKTMKIAESTESQTAEYSIFDTTDPTTGKRTTLGKFVDRIATMGSKELYNELQSNDAVKQFVNKDDMGKMEAIFSLPHWLAKRFPIVKEIYDRQISRFNERSAAVMKSLQEVPSFFGKSKLSQKDKESLRDLIWKLEGKETPEEKAVKKFISDPAVKLVTNRPGIMVNPDYYKVYDAMIDKQQATPAAKAAMKEIRRSLDHDLVVAHNKMSSMSDIDDNVIDKFRSQIGEVKNYFPHHRYGKYFFSAKGADGKTIYREHFDATNDIEAQAKANKIWKRVKAQHPTATTKSWGENKQLPDDVLGAPIDTDAMDQILNEMVNHIQDPQERAEMKKLMAQGTVDILKARGWGSHGIKRENIPGFEMEDIERVLYDYKSGLYGWLTKLEAAKDFSGSLRKIKAKDTPELYRWSRRYVSDVLRNSDRVDRILGNFKAFFFYQYLGGSLKTAAINSTQNLIAGIPRMGLDIPAGRVQLWLRAAGDTIANAVTKGKTLKGEEAQVLRELYEDGSTQANYVREIQGQLKSGVLPSPLGKALDTFANLLGKPMEVVESFNRQSIALAVFRAARAGNLKASTKARLGMVADKANYDQAKELAKEIMNDSHFVLGKQNQPQLVRGEKGRYITPAYTFRSFSHNILSLWRWGLSKEMRNQGGMRMIAESIGATVALGGLAAVPFFATLSALLAAASGDDEELMTKIKRGLKGHDTLRDLICYGAPSLTGFNIGGSLALETPMTQPIRKGGDLKDVFQDIMWTASGIPGAVIESVSNAAKAYKAGQTMRAVETLAPTFAKNFMAAWRLRTEGQTSLKGAPIGEQQKLTQSEAIGKAVGFQPLSMTKNYDAYAAGKMAEDVRSDKINEFVAMEREARKGDEQQRVKWRRAMEKWNREKEKEGKSWMVIQPKDVFRRVKAREAKKKDSKVKKGLKEAMGF